jgi:hypothetical protein
LTVGKNIDVPTCVDLFSIPHYAYISVWITMVWSPVLKGCPFSRLSIHPSTSVFIGLGPVHVTDLVPFVVWVEPVLPFTLVRKPDCEWLVKNVSQRHPVGWVYAPYPEIFWCDGCLDTTIPFVVILMT